MSDLDVQLRSYLDLTAPPVEFDEIVTERFRDASVRPATLSRSAPRPIHFHRSRWARATVGAVATITIMAVIFLLVGREQTRPSSDDTSATETTQRDGEPIAEGTPTRLHSDDHVFQVTIPAPGWEVHDEFAMTKSTRGPQGAEAIIYWGQFPRSTSMTMCADELTQFGPADFEDTGWISRILNAVSGMHGLDIVEGPAETTVGGYPAGRISVRVQDDRGCDPGYFYGWQPWRGGAFWDSAGEGDTIRVWIVDIGDRQVGDSPSRRDLLFIGGVTTQDAGPAIDREIAQIVESVQFDDGATTAETSTTVISSTDGILNRGEHELAAEGVPFTITITMPQNRSWQSHGGFMLSKSTQGPQDAEAVLYWTNSTSGGALTACHFFPFPMSLDALSNVPGLDLLAGPRATSVGGRSAQQFSYTVREDLGCDPGYFFGWKPSEGGALWYGIDIGARIDVWIVDLGGRRMFIAGLTTLDAKPSVLLEIDEIVESIRFED